MLFRESRDRLCVALEAAVELFYFVCLLQGSVAWCL